MKTTMKTAKKVVSSQTSTNADRVVKKMPLSKGLEHSEWSITRGEKEEL